MVMHPPGVLIAGEALVWVQVLHRDRPHGNVPRSSPETEMVFRWLLTKESRRLVSRRSALASEMPRIGAASRPGWFLNTKLYIQEDLIQTLPSYKHPDFVHSSNIGIVFNLNVYTRAHFSLRARITSNSNFYRYVTRTIYSCHFHWWRGSSLETYGDLRIFRANKSIH